MAGKTAILTLKILGDAKDATKALDDTASSAGKLQDGVGKAAVPAAAALAGLAAAGLSAAKAAAEDQAAAGQLAVALRNGAGATDKQIASTETWISKTSKAAAVADDELRPALATLVRSTGDVEESQKAMGVALDVSAATGKDVESVSTALAKAYAGNTTSLGKLVPGMDKAILASGDMDAIMAELARTTGGAAAEAANSAAGQMEGMKIQMGEAQEAIGAALLPALTSLTGILAGVAGWVQDNTQLFLIIGGVIGVVAAAILILNVAFKAYAVITKAISAATKIWAAVQWVLNAAMAANPIVLIVLAVIALIAVIVLIATKTTWFQDIWETVWGAIKSAAEAVWNWLKNAAEIAFAFIAAVVMAYVNIYIAIWKGLVNAVEAVWNFIKNAVSVVLNIIVGIIRGYIAIYVGIFEGIKSAVGAVWDGLKDAATSALNLILAPINAVRSAFDKVVNAIRDVIDWLGRIKLPKVLTDIGGIIGGLFSTSAAPASVSSGRAFTGAPTGRAAFAAPSLSGLSTAHDGAPTIVIQGALDPVAVARQIRNILTNDDRRRSGVVIA